MKSRISTLLTAMTLLAALATPVQSSTKGQIITFDVTGAGTCAGCGTFAFGVNLWGSIVGYYVDSSGVNHGFLLSQ